MSTEDHMIVALLIGVGAGVFLSCASGQDFPPMPPGFTPTKQYKVLRSPKDASIQTVPMARVAAVIFPPTIVSNTCSLLIGLAGQCNGTNVYYWTVTANTGNGFFQIESSTNMVNWIHEFGSQDMCYTPTNSRIALTGYWLEGTEKRRFFRNRQ